MSAIYIAARFSRRHECHALAKQLQSLGHTITSRWVMPDADHVIPTGSSERAADSERRRFAMEDCDDVRAADWTISLMQEPRDNSRGGRHIEFGMALALGHRLTIIGPRETVFHHLDEVEHFETVEDFLKENDTLTTDKALLDEARTLIRDSQFHLRIDMGARRYHEKAEAFLAKLGARP